MPVACFEPRIAVLSTAAAGESAATVERIKMFGVVAQLGERSVRNAEAEGSNPFGSINQGDGFVIDTVKTKYSHMIDNLVSITEPSPD